MLSTSGKLYNDTPFKTNEEKLALFQKFIKGRARVTKRDTEFLAETLQLKPNVVAKWLRKEQRVALLKSRSELLQLKNIQCSVNQSISKFEKYCTKELKLLNYTHKIADVAHVMRTNIHVFFKTGMFPDRTRLI